MKQNTGTIFVDIDGTLAECVFDEFDELYEKGFFANLRPYRPAVNAVKAFAEEGRDICILSCYLEDSDFAVEEKKMWLERHLPGIPYLLVPCGKSKAAAVMEYTGRRITRQDILLDDYTVNLNDWKESGGRGLKILNGRNDTHGSWQGDRISMNSCYADMRRCVPA